MKGSVCLALVWLTVAACATTGPLERVSMPTTRARPFVAGYHPYWTGDTWSSYPMDVLDELFFFELEVGADGRIADAHGWPDRWGGMVAEAMAQGVQVVPTIALHDPEAFELLFPDADRVGRLVDTILELIDATPGMSGIHLDVEVFQKVGIEARDGYTAFVARLAERMRRAHPRLSLSVFVLAFDDDDVYNERALGQIADFVIVQGYDYHSTGSANAGPVGAVSGWDRLNWRTVLERFDGFGVPREKMVMSVPLYGYEWPVASAEPGAEALGPGITVPYTAPDDVLTDAPRARDQAERHGVRRDPVSGSPFYVYETPGEGWIQGWFEDAESLRMKYDFVAANGLGGIAVFPLAYGDAELWSELRRAFGLAR